MIDYIILEVAVSGPSQIRDRVLHILNLLGGSVQQIREIIRGYLPYFFSKNLLFLFVFSSKTIMLVNFLPKIIEEVMQKKERFVSCD